MSRDLTLFEQMTGHTWDGQPLAKEEPVAERKSVQPYLFDGRLFGVDTAFTRMTFIQAMNFFEGVSILHTAVDRLAQELAAVEIVVVDRRTGKEVGDHPILELLRRPSPMMDKYSFMYTLAVHYLVCGNAFPFAMGNVNFEPAELRLMSPIQVGGESDEWGEALRYQTERFQWDRVAVSNRQWRFRDQAGLNELMPIRHFVADRSQTALFGISKLNPVYSELCQFGEQNKHNLSLLKRGARPSVLFSVPESLTDNQYERAQEQINTMFSGANNSGRPMLMEGGATVEDLMVNPRDMDFIAMRKSLEKSVSIVLGLPLPLITDTAMTYDNLSSASLALYEQAVLPLSTRLLGALGDWLFPRYRGSDNFVLTQDERTIPAIQYRRSQVAAKLVLSESLTDNEIRAALWYDPRPGGDVVYKPISKAPSEIAAKFVDGQGEQAHASAEASRRPQPAARPATSKSAEPEDTARKFKRLLLEQKDADGNPVYTEAQADVLVQSRFGG